MTEVAHRDIPLNWDVFVTKRQGLTRDLPPGKEQWMWVPTSATLIYGQRDAVLVDALLTIEQAHALVDWVAASGKHLTTIYVTHSHGDHFFGIAALQNRFPKARAVATPDVVRVMQQQASPESVANFWSVRFPGQIPKRLVIAEAQEDAGTTADVEHAEAGTLSWSKSGIPTPTTRPACMSRPSAWSSLGMSPTTTFTLTSSSQTRKPAASGSRRSTRSSLFGHAR